MITKEKAQEWKALEEKTKKIFLKRYLGDDAQPKEQIIGRITFGVSGHFRRLGKNPGEILDMDILEYISAKLKELECEFTAPPKETRCLMFDSQIANEMKDEYGIELPVGLKIRGKSINVARI